MILPNTFLIGVQKAATTSYYNWLSQHPEISAPVGLKDIEFFIRPEYYQDKGFEFLSERYGKEYKDEKIILQGCVHYIFFEEAISRIKDLNKNAKLILILRNPVERAISAYNYAKKFNYESLSMKDAFKQENKRMESNDIRALSELTYINHSLYYKQIKTIYKYFPKNHLHIIFYEDIKADAQKEIKKTLDFLKVDNKFQIDFKIYNNTGKVRNKTFQRIVFGDNLIRNFFVRKILKKILSENLTKKARWGIMDLNTKKQNSNYLEEIDNDFKRELYNLLKEDIELLEDELKLSLDHWKP